MTEKEHPDINDSLQNEGPEVVRERVSKAKKYKAKAKQNGGDEAPPWDGEQGDPERGEPPKPRVKIVATPYIWRDPKSIPPRDFLYGKHFARGFLSGTVATGGVGKSSELQVEIAAMITGRDLLGVTPKHPLRVWYINLEDAREEIDRRMAAIWKHYAITPMDIGDRLFIDSGRERKIIIANKTKSGLVIARPVVDDICEAVQLNRIDVVSVDPFVRCAQINENDNNEVAEVCQEWSTIAELGCAVDLTHHVRKGGSSNRDGNTVEDARGASSLGNSCRSFRVLNTMTRDEGDRAGVERHRSYFRVDNGKVNFAPPSDQAEWRKLTSVDLGNATKDSEEDHVAVVTAWAWPSPMETLTVADLRAAQKAVSESGPWRESSQAKDWVGNPIAAALGLDPKDKAHQAKIKGALKIWMSNGMFVEVEGKDHKSNPRTFIGVGKWADDENSEAKLKPTQRPRAKGETVTKWAGKKVTKWGVTFQVLGPAPAGTACAYCKSADPDESGPVTHIDGAASLHEACAPAWINDQDKSK